MTTSSPDQPENKSSKTGVRLAAQIHQELKLIAAYKNMSIKDLIADAWKLYKQAHPDVERLLEIK